MLSGVVVWALWIGLDGHYPALPFLGKRGGFDVDALAPAWRPVFIAARMLGLVVLVPLVEELFWRSFLMRWLIDPDFHKVPVGHVTVAGGGDHVGHVRTGPSGMAAGADHGTALGVAALAHAIPGRLRGEPRHGQPRTGDLRDRHRRLEILVSTR